MILDKHYWWTADRTKVVPDGHPDAAFLAWAKGHEVADPVARQYGILTDEAETAEAETDAAHEDAAEAKAKATPANKAKAAPANKSK